MILLMVHNLLFYLPDIVDYCNVGKTITNHPQITIFIGGINHSQSWGVYYYYCYYYCFTHITIFHYLLPSGKLTELWKIIIFNG